MTDTPPDDTGVFDLSLADTYRARCPLCGTEFDAKIWRIIDLDANPDRQSDIRDGSLQRTYCPVCIGPGVERLGALCVVGTGSEGRTRLQFAFGRKGVIEAIQALTARFSKRCADYGIEPDSIPVVGSGIVNSMSEVVDDLAKHSELTLQATSPERLRTALGLVYAKDCDERRAILTANPDLVRPGAIRTLASLPDLRPDVPRVLVRPILGLLTAATRQGIDAASETCRADHDGRAFLVSLPDKISSDYLAAFPESDSPSAAELESRGAKTERFLGEHPDFHGDLKAGLFHALGEGWQALAANSSDAAGARARSWLSRIIDDDNPAITRRSRLEAHRALSASWDGRLEGSPIENNREALHHAEAAVEIAQAMSDEDLAVALLELGIARTRQVTGDPFANRALAREAFHRAKLPGVSEVTRLMVIYNEALTWIEEGSGDIVGKIDIGISMLRVLREQASDAFRPDQQQLTHQSLGAALLRRGSHTDDVDDFGEAAQEFADAFRLAIERQDHRARARLTYCHYAARAELMVRGAEQPNPKLVLSSIDDIQKIYGPQQSPMFFLDTERLRALVLEKFPPADAPANALLIARQRIAHTLLQNGATETAWADFLRLGLEQERSDDVAGAARSFEEAARVAEGLLASASTSMRRDEEIANTSRIYSALIRTLVILSDRGAADGWYVLAAMERARARDLLEGLGSRDLPAPADVPESLLEEERELRTALGGEPEDNIAQMIGANDDTGRRIMQRQALHERLVQIYEAIAATGSAGAAYVALRRPVPPDIASLRAAVDSFADGTGVLSYWIEATGAVGVFAKPRAPVIVRPLDFTEADAQLLLEGLQAQVEAPVRLEDPGLKAWQLYGQHLLEPFEHEIRSCNRLIIVPHGPAHRFPFHALRLASSELLVDVVATQHVPSLAILRDLEPASIVPGKMKAQVLCSTLTPKDRASFQAEAELVANLLGTDAILDATRAQFLEKALDADIIHLVCHGRFDDDDPLAGELILSDGPVTVRDLLTVRLRSSLVSLAACETGMLAAAKGDRLKGFAQALLLAGARTTLLTLWDVWSEPTRFWMEQFYQSLLEPEAPAHGLASAHQRATLATRRRHPDPTCWAPFILSGRTD